MKLIVTGFDRVRLPDVVSREVHRALPARAHAAGQPQLPRGLDGQAARRVRAEHRVHAGAARRAAVPDGHGRPGLSRTTGSGWRRPASTSRSCTRCPTSSRRRSSAAPTPRTIRSPRSTPARWRNAAELSFRTVDGARARHHLAERSARDGAVRGGVPHAADPVHLRSRAAVRAHVGRRAARRHRRRPTRDLQRLRVRADSPEDRDAARTTCWRWRDALVITRGEHGCSVYAERADRADVRAVPPHRIVDPTGVGDAFRGGFMKGMAAGAPLPA